MNKKYTYKIKGRVFVKKPISKEVWKKYYADIIADFIETFEANITTMEESEMDKEDYYLKGIVKGMWSVYNMIEERMVENE